MKIAVLAWGSLYWDKRNLKILGEWKKGGVSLPVEFARISKDGRLTLVITEEHGTSIETYWAISEHSSLNDAIENLKDRENTNPIGIGYLDVKHQAMCSRLSRKLIKKISIWAESKGVDAVIWTDLKSNFKEKYREKFTIENAMSYLDSLTGKKKENAFEYIDKAPELTKTELRKTIEKQG